jgi:nicotinate-nucleotide adenylyltransferase
MARLASLGIDNMRVLDMEVARAGTTYTIDTLRRLRLEYPKHTRFFYIIGADTLGELHTWKNISEVAGLTDFICFFRPGISAREMADRAAASFDMLGKRVYTAEFDGDNVSSTFVKQIAAKGLPVYGLVPRVVAAYIHSSNIYSDAQHIESVDRDELCQLVMRMIKPAKYRHTLGVEQSAIELARRFDEDENKASFAALAHDCAKECKGNLVEFAAKYGLTSVASQYAELPPAIIHAPLGADAARLLFGITDPDILSAIKWHTTGRAGMSRLEKIIYLADLIEPNRNCPGIDAIRAAAKNNLDTAVLMAMDNSIEYVLSSGHQLDRHTIEAREHLARSMNK